MPVRKEDDVFYKCLGGRALAPSEASVAPLFKCWYRIRAHATDSGPYPRRNGGTSAQAADSRENRVVVNAPCANIAASIRVYQAAPVATSSMRKWEKHSSLAEKVSSGAPKRMRKSAPDPVAAISCRARAVHIRPPRPAGSATGPQDECHCGAIPCCTRPRPCRFRRIDRHRSLVSVPAPGVEAAHVVDGKRASAAAPAASILCVGKRLGQGLSHRTARGRMARTCSSVAACRASARPLPPPPEPRRRAAPRSPGMPAGGIAVRSVRAGSHPGPPPRAVRIRGAARMPARGSGYGLDCRSRNPVRYCPGR